MSDDAIQAWQEKAGLHVPSQAIRRLWNELQEQAIETIKIAEREKSGIRDGDSAWHGDVIGHALTDLQSVCERLLNAYDAEAGIKGIMPQWDGE
jgi:hypothetical protein